MVTDLLGDVLALHVGGDLALLQLDALTLLSGSSPGVSSAVLSRHLPTLPPGDVPAVVPGDRGALLARDVLALLPGDQLAPLVVNSLALLPLHLSGHVPALLLGDHPALGLLDRVTLLLGHLKDKGRVWFN